MTVQILNTLRNRFGYSADHHGVPWIESELDFVVAATQYRQAREHFRPAWQRPSAM
ncbi:hypothetical protein [Kibdelosporangium aridum]|uniref:hypothetical protein n=1 Tax=Kibdelosporangium aridum TaxID=2030 RepID=UPI0035EBAEDD